MSQNDNEGKDLIVAEDECKIFLALVHLRTAEPLQGSCLDRFVRRWLVDFELQGHKPGLVGRVSRGSLAISVG